MIFRCFSVPFETFKDPQQDALAFVQPFLCWIRGVYRVNLFRDVIDRALDGCLILDRVLNTFKHAIEP